MNIWVIIAVAFSGLFTVVSLMCKMLNYRGAAVFVILAAICCDIYLAYNQNTLPDLMRFMFLFLGVFQIFVFFNVMIKPGSSSRRIDRGY